MVILGFFIFTSFASADSFGLDITKNSSGIETSNEMNSVEGITARIISTALTFLSVIFFLLIVYSGGRWMLARGNSDEIKKAQDSIIMAVIGVIIILGSNALVNFVFQSVGVGTPQQTSSQTCVEAHPGWQVLDLNECAGYNYSKNITNIGQCYFFEGTFDSEDGGKKNNCNSRVSDVEPDQNKKVCCLPYISKCARSYPGYECVDNPLDLDDPLDCDTGTAKRQIGLCDSVNDGGDVCCQSSEVWCLIFSISDTNASFQCTKSLGKCEGKDFDGNEADKTIFNSAQSCREEGERRIISLN